jgi:xanthine dehydrogenase accessory factor
VHEARLTALRDLGLSEAQLSRVHGPVGLIPSARDPGTLAVSVLAEALTKAIASCR